MLRPSVTAQKFAPWKKFQQRLRPARILLASFAGLILLGAAVLALPLAAQEAPVPFVDALFTATSAVCVTGLTVVDTGTTFSPFGQIVIVILIQLGGLGVMTFSMFFVALLGGRLSFGGRDLLQETLSQRPIQNLRGLLKLVVASTFMIEAAGAVVLSLRFMQNLPSSTAIYHGIFHAVSAFCNAGFGLYRDNLVSYQADLAVNFTITTLIILGGLGFIVIFELTQAPKQRRRAFSLHTKLVLTTTGILILAGTALFMLLEHYNGELQLPWARKTLAAYFHSVSARTAGFNTVDIGALTDATLFMLIFLMFVGASPGSCGGGIKTTTFATLVALIRSRFRNQEEVQLFYRTLPNETISKAVSVAFFSFLPIVLFSLILLVTEGGGHSHHATRGLFLEVLFESTSAFGTVGLSTGITPSLTVTGKILITLLMFIGRLGPMTVAIAVSGEKKYRFKYAQENILIG